MVSQGDVEFTADGLTLRGWLRTPPADSDGQRREEVDHCGQIEGWRSAITFTTTLAEIDAARIGR